jgi:imidazolonepropionase
VKTPIAADLIVENAHAVLTCAGEPGSPAAARLGAVPRGAVAVRDGRIAWVGPQERLAAEVERHPGCRTVDAAGGLVAPGYIDAHTHVVFGGDRAREYGLRCGGATYQEIAAAGGGIVATVRATRAASREELCAAALPRLRRLLAEGVTTAEAKSGYGLTFEDEWKLLEAVRDLGTMQPIDLLPTVLPLHAVPPEARESASARERWLSRVIEELVPAAAEAGLARFADAFPEGGFTFDEVRRLAAAARRAGLPLRLHVDQLDPVHGAELAAELHALTADHLETVFPEGIEAMARAGVAACLVPVSTLFLKCKAYAPGRGLVTAGVRLCLGSNVNPGSAMTESYSLALGLACLGNGLSPAEAFLAATADGADVLGLADRGRLVPGLLADLVVHGVADVDHLAYHLATRHARVVIKAGRVVFEAPELPARCV